MFHYNQSCEGVEPTNRTFRASNLQVILLTKESESLSALDGKRLYFETETGVDKTRNMEHSGTFRNMAEHSGT